MSKLIRFAPMPSLKASRSLSSILLGLLAISSALGFSQAVNAANKPAKIEFDQTDQPVQFPDVPQYTGKFSYVGSTLYPSQGGAGKLVNATYLVQEEPDTVLQWYSEVLKNFQWLMGDTKGQSKSIYGSKGKTTCSVSASPYKGPFFRTQVTISYRYAE
jgi:hypothetical protein